MSDVLAVVGLACRYPEADTPDELWENVLSQRRSFRRIPEQRLNLADYYSPDPATPDAIYAQYAAVLEDYEFDRVRFRISGSSYRSADLTHWLALEVADDALSDAGFAGLPVDRDRVGVVVGNSLTGEFSRASVLRLRWPYVRRQVDSALSREGWDAADRGRFLAQLERDYKAPFATIGEDSLAGSLSNTIAGRICNAFDLHGGGHTVDAACASSLLAVITAGTSLLRGDVDLALAGGVDLSLDAFELIGFAKTQALATDVMRIYDQRSNGFWPGEGCGMVVLARLEDALAWGARVYATIRGWGVSSDGSGGLTRPRRDGHLLALRRAYARAGYGIDTVSLLEGHGTGTAVGDATELAAFTEAGRHAGARPGATAIGSIKANIGHTKAAAGVAGLIKAVLSVDRQVLPPTTGCERPDPVLSEPGAPLRVLGEPEPWPAGRPVRAGLSAMGFGGINTHLTIEGTRPAGRRQTTARERTLSTTFQDVELFAFAAADRRELGHRVARLHEAAAGLSFGQLRDLAIDLATTTPGDQPVRAALLAATPGRLHDGLGELAEIARGARPAPAPGGDLAFAEGTTRPRIGFAFSGQGAPAHLDGGALARRFPDEAGIVRAAGLDPGGDPRDTAVAQPAIVSWSLAAVAVLERMGITADVAVGHSLGELAALSWAGAFGPSELQELARARGRAMAACPADGRMAELATDGATAAEIVAGGPVVVAAYNAPRRTVISGPEREVMAAAARARARGIAATPLRVTRAFHSPLVAAAAADLSGRLRAMTTAPLSKPVVSTVTGAPLAADVDLRSLLVRQLTEPVRFVDAVTALGPLDLLIEVGPGRILTDLLRAQDRAAVATEAGAGGLHGLLAAVAAAFVAGAPVDLAALATGRAAARKPALQPRSFLANPCELAPGTGPAAPRVAVPEPEPEPAETAEPADQDDDAVQMLCKLVAARAELPVAAVHPDSRLLTDLHLNSITVAQITGEAATALGVQPPAEPSQFADATVAELAQVLAEAPPADGSEGAPPGIESWLRTFTVSWSPREAGHPAAPATRWRLAVPDDDPLATALRATFGPDAEEPTGLLVCVDSQRRSEDAERLLDAVRAAAEDPRYDRFVLVHRGDSAGMAKTLAQEQPRLTVAIVEVAGEEGPPPPELLQRIRAEADAAAGFAEVRLRPGGGREVPRLRPIETAGGARYLGPGDVLLVSGGGKGIGAEAALGLAASSGARVALLGRSPIDDPEVAATLARFRAAAVEVRYLAADVADAAAVEAAVAEAGRLLGPPTALLHAAGVNHPARIGGLDRTALAETITPKVAGLRHLLSALDTDRLRLVLAFGSIIGAIGMRGEAHYALANGWLTAEVAAAADRLPHCRCRVIQWSVWSGVGMGHRLGVTDALQRSGVMPINIDDAVELCRRVVDTEALPVAVVATGRFGAPPTLPLAETPSPLLRFVERPIVHYPGVELVAEASLSLATDPYLADHALDRMPLVPAVLGLEAMAQAARVVAGRPVIGFADVALPRPITVPPDGSRVLRLAALVRGDHVTVAIRSDESGFGVDHFRATVLLAGATHDDPETFRPEAEEQLATAAPAAAPAPAELYGRLLFHGDRFRRVSGYRQLRARHAVAEVTVDDDSVWFGGYLPPGLLLGDFAARDAFLHAAQACVPQRRVLPVAIGSIVLRHRPPTGRAIVVAVERYSDRTELRFDLAVFDAAGRLCEVWRDLRLRAVEPIEPPPAWPPELAGPYLERALTECGVPVLGVAITGDGADRPARAGAAVAALLGPATRLGHRSDGAPIVPGAHVSLSHNDALSMVVSAGTPVGCDLEPVAERHPETWARILGADRLPIAEMIAKENDERLSVAATRVWTAVECLRKAAGSSQEPILLDHTPGDGWVVLRAGRWRVATLVMAIATSTERVAAVALAA
ncbi:MAG TPA: SDR family NAD(P)-dependent oxidoreductase [Actinoplanes sp.]|nr:SDR family NAD(P)-dependent oxidoreductase [Actinoplanes sp.]